MSLTGILIGNYMNDGFIVITGILFGLVVLIIYWILRNLIKTLRRTREVEKAKKCPYKIEGGLEMPKTHVKITISIPEELDKVIDSLVAESKKTTKPMSKSGFIAVCVYEYLDNSLKILDSQKKPEEGGKA